MKPVFIPYTVYTIERHVRYESRLEDASWKVSNQTIFKLAKEINLTELVKENLKYVNESL